MPPGSPFHSPGDYDGDGIATPAVFEPATGVWSIIDAGGGLQQRALGAFADPIPGNWGAGMETDPAVQWWASGSISYLDGANQVAATNVWDPGVVVAPQDSDNDLTVEPWTWRRATAQFVDPSGGTITLGTVNDFPLTAPPWMQERERASCTAQFAPIEPIQTERSRLRSILDKLRHG